MGVASVYLNGQKQSEKNIGKNLGNMEINESIFIANAVQNFNPWMCEILILSFYHKGLQEMEVKELFDSPYLSE